MTSEDWNIVAAVGQCLGAVATFLAVWVALRAESRVNSIRLKVRAVVEPVTILARCPAIRIVVVNLSYRPVTLVGSGVRLPNGEMLNDLRYRGSLLHEPLKEWDRVECILDSVWLYHELKLRGVKTAVRLWLFVEDATGKRHWNKITFDPVPHGVEEERQHRERMAETYKSLGNALKDVEQQK